MKTQSITHFFTILLLFFSSFLFSNNPEVSNCFDNEIYCGETQIYSNYNSGNDINYFSGCSTGNYQGNDIVVKFERYSYEVENWITLWNHSYSDFDIFIYYDECPISNPTTLSPFSPTATCIASSLNYPKNCSSGPLNYETINLSNMAPGTYYIVIDIESASSYESEIYLSLSCEGLNCSNANDLECGVNYGNNLDLYNSTSNYYSCYDNAGCFNSGNTSNGLGFQGSFTAGEEIWLFTAPESGYYTFELNPDSNIDLELFALDFCCDGFYDDGGIWVVTDADVPGGCFGDGNCVAASTNSSGQSESVELYLTANQTIYLVVDGFLGDAGSYTLSVDCGDDFDCSGAIPVDCGETISSNNYNGTNSSDSYCNSSSGMTGKEMIYSITPGETGEYEFYLGKQTGIDLDMFILSSCDVNSCIASSDNSTSTASDYISIVLNANHTYYIVIDGDYNNGQTPTTEGQFSLYINCDMDCSNPRYLECGVPDFWSNYEVIYGDPVILQPSDISIYKLTESGNTKYYTNLSGPEVIYSFIPPESANYTFELDDIESNQDLEIFILLECDETTAIGTTDGPNSYDPDIVTKYLQGEQEYFIIVDGDNGSESTYSLSVSGCPEPTAVSDFSNEEIISFYPNPATNQLFFSKDVQSIIIYNILGNRVISEKNIGKSFNISTLTPGVYLVELNDERYRMKLIVE